MSLETRISDHIACKATIDGILLDAYREDGDLWKIFRSDLQRFVEHCQDLETIVWEIRGGRTNVFATRVRINGDSFKVLNLDWQDWPVLNYLGQDPNRGEYWTARWDSAQGQFVHELQMLT
jgi:hypothetical protein